MHKVEYIWIDGTEPSPALRSKTKVVNEGVLFISDVPVWGFDGSSTNQAPGENSDCVLEPVRVYKNPLEENCSLVICEVMNVDGSPHETNTRFELKSIMLRNNDEPWFGMEQEYTLFQEGRPCGWPRDKMPPPQGDYYCGRNAGENIAREHLEACIAADIAVSGINSEVMLGQWEYQIGAADPLKVSDDLWVARWLMEKICAKYGVTVSLDPKPIAGDWNGAGCHTNFSAKAMREAGGRSAIAEAIEKMSRHH